MKQKNLTIGYVGMSHLGINSAVATAEKGANVICFDQDEENINKLNLLNVDIDEPYLLKK